MDGVRWRAATRPDRRRGTRRRPASPRSTRYAPSWPRRTGRLDYCIVAGWGASLSRGADASVLGRVGAIGNWSPGRLIAAGDSPQLPGGRPPGPAPSADRPAGGVCLRPRPGHWKKNPAIRRRRGRCRSRATGRTGRPRSAGAAADCQRALRNALYDQLVIQRQFLALGNKQSHVACLDGDGVRVRQSLRPGRGSARRKRPGRAGPRRSRPSTPASARTSAAPKAGARPSDVRVVVVGFLADPCTNGPRS